MLMFLFLVPVSLASCNDSLINFSFDVKDVALIDCAIVNEFEISNFQFSLASASMQEKYVFSEFVNFSDDAQISLFRDIFYDDSDKIIDNEEVIVSYFDFLELNNKSINWSDDDFVLFENLINKSIFVLNTKESTNAGFNLFNFYCSRKTGITFDKIESEFSSFDFDDKLFFTNGSKSSVFSLNEIKYLYAVGFSNFIIESSGLVKAYKFKNRYICNNCDTKITTDGFYINGRNIEMPNNFKLNKGSVIIRSDNKFRFFANSDFVDNNNLTFSVSKDTDYVFEDVCKKNNDISCIEFSKENNYYGYYLKNNNKVEVVDETNSFKHVNVGKINDDSSLKISDGNGNSFFVDDEGGKNMGWLENYNMMFKQNYKGESCSGFFGSIAFTCENPSDIGANINARAKWLRERHNEYVKLYGVGTHYGIKSTSYDYILNKNLDSRSAWVAFALYKTGSFKNVEDTVSLVKRLKKNGFNEQMLLGFFAAFKSGLTIKEAEIAVRENPDKFKIDDGEDFRLSETSCVGFVDEVLKYSFEDIRAGNDWETIENVAYKKNRGKAVYDKYWSVYNLIHFLATKKNWEVIYAAPSGGSSFLNKDNVFWIKGLKVDYILKNYYEDPNNPDFLELQNNPNLKSGVVSLNRGELADGAVGFHSALLIRDENNELAIIENHWKEEPSSTNLFDVTKFENKERDNILIAVPPGSLDSKGSAFNLCLNECKSDASFNNGFSASCEKGCSCIAKNGEFFDCWHGDFFKSCINSCNSDPSLDNVNCGNYCSCLINKESESLCRS